MHDLLDMSRIISGKVRLNVQRIDVEEVVKAAVASVRHSGEAKDIRLKTVFEANAGPVRADANRLQQCFWNLLSNAIKFTPKGSEVRVAVGRVDRHVEISVTDSGQRISREFLPHIFERFRQADASTTRRHGGLGLGLSIVKHLVELHGGVVQADSAGGRPRSDFSYRASAAGGGHPRTRAGAAASIRAQRSGAGSRTSFSSRSDGAGGRRSKRREKSFERVMEECGARVLLATSAEEGLEIVRSARPDVIVSDIGMPKEDGHEFIRQVLPAIRLMSRSRWSPLN